ncbi:MAG: TatD family hydrolase [Clostridiales bacterium]|jgi:TatD DNase family protein|nr:TatD family hydrolase [Clostridiales bacterium]
MFDTHAHIDDEKFNDDRAEVIAGFKAGGVDCIVDVGANLETSRMAVELARENGRIYASVGVHPCDVEGLGDDDLAELERLARECDKVVAIGEIGLDYHYIEADDAKARELQKEWFKRQIMLAKRLGLPMIIHDREAHEDVLEIVDECGYYNGIMHCFSGDADLARKVVARGFYVAFGGVLTYKNAPYLREALAVVPNDRLLTETDCPYLAPDGYRGQRNEPKFMHKVLEKMAEVKRVSVAEIEAMTVENARRVYGIKGE